MSMALSMGNGRNRYAGRHGGCWGYPWGVCGEAGRTLVGCLVLAASGDKELGRIMLDPRQDVRIQSGTRLDSILGRRISRGRLGVN
jgi:hypothetical protein